MSESRDIDAWIASTDLLMALGNYLGYDALVFLSVRAVNLAIERGDAEGWNAKEPIRNIGWFQEKTPGDAEGKPIVRAW